MKNDVEGNATWKDRIHAREISRLRDKSSAASSRCTLRQFSHALEKPFRSDKSKKETILFFNLRFAELYIKKCLPFFLFFLLRKQREEEKK